MRGRNTVVGASIRIEGKNGKYAERDIQVRDHIMSDFIPTIRIGDRIKIKGLMILRVNVICTTPIKDIFENYTLSKVTLYCSVGDN